MLAILASALLIVLASVVVGRTAMLLLGWRRPEWVAGAVGLAILVVLAPFLVRLPGRGLTSAILLALLTVVCAVVTRRCRARAVRTAASPAPAGAAPGRADRGARSIALACAAVPLQRAAPGSSARASTRTTRPRSSTGPTGLPTASARSPRRSSWGTRWARRRSPRRCPRAPAIDLVDVFNGLLIAIPALTALAALIALAAAAPVASRRGRGADRPAVPRSLVPRAVRVQGDGDGAASSSRSACAAPRDTRDGEEEREVPPARAVVGVARPARRRLRLHVLGPRRRSGSRSRSRSGPILWLGFESSVDLAAVRAGARAATAAC